MEAVHLKREAFDPRTGWRMWLDAFLLFSGLLVTLVQPARAPD
ncbi:hypothetical protein ACLBKT_05995 [Erythrobacter sp. W302b]